MGYRPFAVGASALIIGVSSTSRVYANENAPAIFAVIFSKPAEPLRIATMLSVPINRTQVFTFKKPVCLLAWITLISGRTAWPTPAQLEGTRESGQGREAAGGALRGGGTRRRQLSGRQTAGTSGCPALPVPSRPAGQRLVPAAGRLAPLRPAQVPLARPGPARPGGRGLPRSRWAPGPAPPRGCGGSVGGRLPPRSARRGGPAAAGGSRRDGAAEPGARGGGNPERVREKRSGPSCRLRARGAEGSGGCRHGGAGRVREPSPPERPAGAERSGARRCGGGLVAVAAV
ncbi:cuticle collagen 2-like [Aquila chrysaetos chrysaetos]|uniref:cuticle collagen 2-like n=1 Tax=Aquila chrysaetos chrysaetos TaxID=223781 RepID=UPI0011765709|nr:cuticle collagen 2-like [Aquila chrysaetos chrysaetos]